MSHSHNQMEQPNQHETTLARLEQPKPKNLKTDTPNDDQCFLLYFIMGTYFGPHINGDKKSVLQRVAEGLPSYTRDQLATSFIKVAELERIYYYILRNVDKSLTVKLPFLRRFIQGLEGSNSVCNYPQFTDLFPLELHPQSRFKSSYKIIESIVFIDNPETCFFNREDVERFKRLSGLEDFLVDKDVARLYNCFDGSGLRNNKSVGKGKVMSLPENKCGRNTGSRKVNESDDFSEIRHQLPRAACAVTPISTVPFNEGMALESEGDDSVKVCGPAVLFLPSRPTKKEWSNVVAATKKGFGLTGSAAMGRVGPIMGLVDIGECEDSYLFRISLPGVKRDEKEFSCEVDTNGKVLINGVTTTGEKTVSKYSQVFQMQTQNLCPPGHFSVTFQLPGPVDPHQFSGNFGTDGILEGMVMKGKPR
ncbi:increased DNA methylation 2-like [Trifolium pratense]|uniref:increased DNA methylation 2-like n=1 Tax=Trifolium pratense TaxID=57577 RepID=UPI001E694466|nr:increased DNA methylation 2-like [Trifolium pratense]